MRTSDAQSCFVYIQLPGSLDVVTCGRFLQSEGVGQFVYGRSYLSNPKAVELERSYLLLADELRRWVSNPDADLRELFARMVFNALISNVDDHPRNHALIAPGAGWELSPAYDLTPSPQFSTERDLAMEVGKYHRRANRRNLLSECGRFRLYREEAARMIDRMKGTVTARWRQLVREAGANEADCTAIERAFGYDGFEYQF